MQILPDILACLNACWR